MNWHRGRSRAAPLHLLLRELENLESGHDCEGPELLAKLSRVAAAAEVKGEWLLVLAGDCAGDVACRAPDGDDLLAVARLALLPSSSLAAGAASGAFVSEAHQLGPMRLGVNVMHLIALAHAPLESFHLLLTRLADLHLEGESGVGEAV